MYCPICGYENPDGASFCQNCGGALPSADDAQNVVLPEPEQEAQVYQPAPEPQTQNYEAPAQPLYSAPAYHAAEPVHPVLKIIRSVGSSGAFLTAAILYSAAVLFSFISSLVNSSSIMRVTINLPGGYDYGDVLRASRGATIAGAFISLIPTALIAIGLWLVYSPFSTAGLTMIKVIVIIALVAVCVAAVVLLIALLFVSIRGSDLSSLINDAMIQEGIYDMYGNYSGAISGSIGALTATALIFAFILLAGVLTLVIFYFVKILKTINTVKRSANTLTASDRVSPFVAVMLFIFGGISGIASLGTLASGAILSGITSALSATVCIIFGVLIFKYRNQMRAYMAANAQPYVQVQPRYNGGSYQQVTGVTCPRCSGIYASNLSACPYCGLPKQNF